MKEDIKEKFMQSIECKTKVINDDKIISQVEDVCNKLIECYKNGHRVYIMGNGGSAADAQHFSAELVGRYMMERKGLPAVAFTTDTSILTAVGNDYGYDDVFRRQTEALVEKGDVVFGISTSGNSKNIYNALKLAKEIGATTIGFLGKTGGTCKELCDIPIVIEYPRTPNIQEAHEMIMHTICEIVEKNYMNKAVFLDRDGTINVDKDYLYKKEDWEFIDGVVDGLQILQNLGYKLIVISNQSGIARGYYTREDADVIFEYMVNELKKYGVIIDKYYYCPHIGNDCNCRKPKLGLFYQAQKDFDIDFSKSYAIGDKIRDLSICEKEQVKGFLLDMVPEIESKNIRKCKNLYEAVNLIKKDEQNG